MTVQEFFQDQLLKRWYTPVGGLLTAGLFGLITTVAVAAVDLHRLPLVAWIVGATAFLGAMGYWWLVNRRPRASRDRIGVLVALRCDDEDHAKRIRRQLVEQIRHLLEDRGPEHQLELVEYSGHRAERVTLRTVEKAMVKSRCQFAVFGSATMGNVNGEVVHLMKVQGSVRVGSVHPLVRQNLQSEFDAVMPRRIEVGEKNEIPLFEGHSESIECTARYMLGLAALAAGNLAYAEALLTDLYQRAQAPGVPKHRALVKMRGGRQMAALHEAKTRRAVTAYRRSKQRDDLHAVEEYAHRIRDYQRNNINALLALAFAAFELRRDVKAARQLLRPLLTQGDPSPKYSEAFLLSYEEKLCSALALYRKAFKVRSVGRELAAQCAEHMRATLAEEPHRFGLHFALAVVSYEALDDAQGAAAASRAFLGAPESQQYPRECKVVRKILAAAEGRVGAGVQVSKPVPSPSLPAAEPPAVKAPANALPPFPPLMVPAKNA